jgi:uncharacterized damage-inducible protein DinB
MLDELRGVVLAYTAADRILDRLVGTFRPGDWTVRDEAGHDPRWIMGHIATYRNRMLGQMGFPERVSPWEAFFLNGTSPADVPEDLHMAEVLEACRGAHAAMVAAWEALTAEDLARPWSHQVPNGTETLGGALHFMAWHEAYHVGQLGFLSKLAGRKG